MSSSRVVRPVEKQTSEMETVLSPRAHNIQPTMGPQPDGPLARMRSPRKEARKASATAPAPGPPAEGTENARPKSTRSGSTRLKFALKADGGADKDKDKSGKATKAAAAEEPKVQEPKSYSAAVRSSARTTSAKSSGYGQQSRKRAPEAAVNTTSTVNATSNAGDILTTTTPGKAGRTARTRTPKASKRRSRSVGPSASTLLRSPHPDGGVVNEQEEWSELNNQAHRLLTETLPKAAEVLAKKTTKNGAKKFEYKKRCEGMQQTILDLRTTAMELSDEVKNFAVSAMHHLDSTSSAVKLLEAQREALQAEIDTVQQSCETLQEELDSKDVALQDTVVKEQASTQELEETKQANETLWRQTAEQSMEIQQLKAQLAEALKMGEDLAAEKESLSTKNAALEESHLAEVESVRQELTQKHSASVEALQSASNAQAERVSSCEAEMKDLREANGRLQEKVDTAQGELKEQTKSMQDLNESLTSVTKEKDMVTIRYESTQEQLTQKGNELSIALGSLGDIQKASAERESQLREAAQSAELRIQKMEEYKHVAEKELAELRQEKSVLTIELTSTKEGLEKVSADLKARQDSDEATSRRLAELNESLAIQTELCARANSREEEERRERTAACAQLIAETQAHAASMDRVKEDARKQCDDAESKVTAIKQDLEESQKEVQAAQERTMVMEGEARELRSMLEDQKTNTEELVQLARQNGEMDALRHRMQEQEQQTSKSLSGAQERIAALEEEILKGESQRRKLHNVIQELRGNVRVFARVRPFLPGDGLTPETSNSVINMLGDDQGLTILKPKGDSPEAGRSGGAESHLFSFDRVFTPSTGQEQVFNEVSEFVQSALDGYQVCLFSYGQTGSGKTHTMQGSRDGPMRGIIPRAIEQVGKYKSLLEAQGWRYTMEVTFVEIYNEQIRDLLRSGSGKAKGASKEAAPLSHDIRTGKDGQPFITDVTRRDVDPEDLTTIDSIMDLAAQHRAVGVTDMNAQSSRSHSVFTLHLRAENASMGSSLKGALSLVDLAGSERLSRSGAQGERMRETQSINKSLSCLADVFTAIGNKQNHIPFRNSKLTQLLAPALSGDGKTLMMVNLSPTEASYFESLCALRFASNVNKCELGRPKKQVKDLNANVTSSTTTTISASLPPPPPKSATNSTKSSTKPPTTSTRASGIRRPSKTTK